MSELINRKWLMDNIDDWDCDEKCEECEFIDQNFCVDKRFFANAPTIEPNLILPERMERGECYEVGETIVVMNHDDYYDLLCKPTVDKDYLVSLIQEAVYDGEACKRLLDLVEPKQEWIPCSERLPEKLQAVNITWVNHSPVSYYESIKDIPLTATAYYHKDKWWWYSPICEDLLAEYGKSECDKIDDDIEVIAWMPLPTAYMEGAIRDYEEAVEQMEHSILYEPTYNADDGSM